MAGIDNVYFNIKSERHSFYQALLSLGDRRVAPAIEAAERNGGNWRAAVAEAGVDADFFVFRDRSRRRRAAVGHHRRRHEGQLLPRRVRQGAARGVDAAAEAPEGERAAPSRPSVAASSLRPARAPCSCSSSFSSPAASSLHAGPFRLSARRWSGPLAHRGGRVARRGRSTAARAFPTRRRMSRRFSSATRRRSRSSWPRRWLRPASRTAPTRRRARMRPATSARRTCWPPAASSATNRLRGRSGGQTPSGRSRRSATGPGVARRARSCRPIPPACLSSWPPPARSLGDDGPFLVVPLLGAVGVLCTYALGARLHSGSPGRSPPRFSPPARSSSFRSSSR